MPYLQENISLDPLSFNQVSTLILIIPAFSRTADKNDNTGQKFLLRHSYCGCLLFIIIHVCPQKYIWYAIERECETSTCVALVSTY